MVNPEILYGLLLLPLILFICHINLDSTTRNSLKENFHINQLSNFYIFQNNIVLITLMRALFFCLLIAIAGPRWTYHDIETKTNISNNLLLLDVSKSMNAIDLKPNRFEHAKRKIPDQIINESGNFGLVAFAKTSYNLVPFTSDREYIKKLFKEFTINKL